MIDNIEELKGKILTKIEGGIGSDEMRFTSSTGVECALYYEDD
jgi:hypothetical protein